MTLKFGHCTHKPCQFSTHEYTVNNLIARNLYLHYYKGDVQILSYKNASETVSACLECKSKYKPAGVEGAVRENS
jgi:hypothetical protein